VIELVHTGRWSENKAINLQYPNIKSCAAVVVTYVTILINLSFMQGKCLKIALIVPLLKRLGLDLETLPNYLPASNLQFLGKVFEKIACAQIVKHFEEKTSC